MCAALVMPWALGATKRGKDQNSYLSRREQFLRAAALSVAAASVLMDELAEDTAEGWVGSETASDEGDEDGDE